MPRNVSSTRIGYTLINREIKHTITMRVLQSDESKAISQVQRRGYVIEIVNMNLVLNWIKRHGKIKDVKDLPLIERDGIFYIDVLKLAKTKEEGCDICNQFAPIIFAQIFLGVTEEDLQKTCGEDFEKRSVYCKEVLASANLKLAKLY